MPCSTKVLSTTVALLGAWAALPLPSVLAAEPGRISPSALAEDDECAVGAKGAAAEQGHCSLSALQLRSSGVEGAAAASARAAPARGAVVADAVQKLHDSLHGLIGDIRAVQRVPGPGTTTAISCTGDLTEVNMCLLPVLARCPGGEPECTSKQASGLCKCTDAVAQVEAKCPEAVPGIGDLQKNLAVLCSPCGKALLSLRENQEGCMEVDAEGNITGLDAAAACGETCQPLLCSVVSECSASTVPPDGFTDMKSNVNTATEKCPCSQ